MCVRERKKQLYRQGNDDKCQHFGPKFNDLVKQNTKLEAGKSRETSVTLHEMFINCHKYGSIT